MDPLVSTRQLSGFLKTPMDDYDAYSAELYLSGANAAVIEYCGWHIAPTLTETVVVDGSGTLVQPLPTLHLQALTALTEDGRTLDAADIDWSTNGILEKRSCAGWTRRRRGIVADITHGFEVAPPWVVTLICAVAGRAYLTPLGITAESAGGESITYASARGNGAGAVVLLDQEKRMLDRIRLPLAA